MGEINFNVDYTPKSHDKNGEFRISRFIPQKPGHTIALGQCRFHRLSEGLTNGEVISVRRIGDVVTCVIRGERINNQDYKPVSGDFSIPTVNLKVKKRWRTLFTGLIAAIEKELGK